MGPIVRENNLDFVMKLNFEIARWRFHVYQLTDHSLTVSSKGPRSFLEYRSIRQCVLSLVFSLTALLSKYMVSVNAIRKMMTFVLVFLGKICNMRIHQLYDT